MWRTLLLVGLLASPAPAQLSPVVNPYNPYTNLAVRGPLSFRAYSSVDRLNTQRQYDATVSGRFILSAGSVSLTDSISIRTAGFRHYPNYPALNTSRGGLGGTPYAAPSVMRPLPLTAPPLVENSCDPYLDDDGCLSETAGW